MVFVSARSYPISLQELGNFTFDLMAVQKCAENNLIVQVRITSRKCFQQWPLSPILCFLFPRPYGHKLGANWSVTGEQENMRIVWAAVSNLVLWKTNILQASSRAEFSANVNINYLFSAQQAGNKFHRHRARHAHCFPPWLGLRESTFVSLNIAWAEHGERTTS